MLRVASFYRYAGCHYAGSRHTSCHNHSLLVLGVIKLIVIMLSAVMLRLSLLVGVILSLIMLNLFMLILVILSAVMIVSLC